jgi:hypothetical protein
MTDDTPRPWDIVECVDAGPLVAKGLFYGKPSGLRLGARYTVEVVHPKGSICPERRRVWNADFVELREVAHPDSRWGAFPAKRFRLVERGEPGRMGPWGLRH